MSLYKKLFSRWTGIAMAATMGLVACQPEIEVPTPTSGSADFTTYVALGNSLTAGYADGGVYRESQMNSYPEMLAKSIREVNPSLSFSTPLMPEGNGSGYLKLETTGPVPQTADPSWLTSVASGGPYQNMGVPGARVKSLTQVGYGSSQGNPYFTRFASNPLATVVDDAAAQNPTFFTLWIGNNDVLGYATSGGDQGGDAITPVSEFEADFKKILTGLDGAKGGAIANIPDILAAPFFQYVKYDAFPLSAEQAAALNAGLQANLEAGVRPLVVAAVRQEVRSQVTAGAVATIIRPQVEAAVRMGVTADVTAGVRQGVIDAALAQGATQAQAEAQADGYIASEAGQADISTRVDAAMQSDTVQTIIQQNVDAQLALASTQALIDQQTDQQMQTDTVQAIIQQNLDQQVGLILTALEFPVSEGNNKFLIQGQPTQSNPTGLRRASADDLILLTAGSYLSAEAAAGRPPILPERLVLDKSEQEKIKATIVEYNNIIKTEAGAKYAYVDVNGFFSQVISGFAYQGVSYSPTFITGGAFSLDGIHLTQRGYALAGNEFIKAINAKYNSNLSLINVNEYRGVLFP